ncbi:hypothetical protein [Agrobacterium tumefaciens]|uniref:hypothetical protein n=1 Tax=Agrobacterium tumefaciens TaxID=358 RepID=UPI001FA9998F|nr:hypothetical protein [Agrobacterium tumefaciens]UNZ53565.1 hypothetical protein MLE07_22745 [Agrobacterium tumefaciens]
MVLEHFRQKRNRFYVRTIREIKEIDRFVVEESTAYGTMILQDVHLPVPRDKPEDVTGIQPTRVCAAKDSSQPKDLGWLDPCDKHRDEGR